MRGRRGSTVGARPPGRWQLRLARGLRGAFLAGLLLPALVTYRPLDQAARVRAAAAPYAFDLVAWEAEQLAARWPELLDQLRAPPGPERDIAPPDAVAAVRTHFAAGERLRAAVARGAPPAEVEALRAAWLATREPALAALADSLAALASREGLLTATPLGPLLLPPVSFVLHEPPRVLVVSPRDRIEVSQSVLLRADLAPDDVERLETAVEALGLSALVVQIGGIATYPAIVPFQGPPDEILSAIAHEWAHGWLLFHPLGRAWFASYEGRTLNETVADLVGRELGQRLALAYAFPTRPHAAGPPAPVDGFDFRREMRATRERLDALLAAGAIEEAERYLEQRRQEFVAAGYPLRKLNQAYFAFHGSYADSGAVVSSLADEVRALRERSGSLGAFLRRVAAMTTPDEVAAALAHAPAP
jgi:hypothetical protein